MISHTFECVDLQRIHVRCFVKKIKETKISNSKIEKSEDVFNLLIDDNYSFQRGLFAHACEYALLCLDHRCYHSVQLIIDYMLWAWGNTFDLLENNKRSLKQ